MLAQFRAGDTLAATPSCSKANNLVKGTCQYLLQYIASPGVKDDRGTYHKTKQGWTNPYWSPNVSVLSTDPDPIDPNCIIQHIKVVFQVTTDTRKLTWQPVPAPCPANKCDCDKEIADWQARIDAHEAHHVQDAKDIIAETNTQWADVTYQACGKNATQKIASQVKKDVTAEMQSMGDEFDQRGAAFDNSPAGQLFPPNCSTTKCVPCAAGSSSKLLASSGLVSCGTQCCDPSQCQTCDTATNTCVSACSACQICSNGTCVDNCPNCQKCQNGTCVAIDCGDPCLVCQNNSCVPISCPSGSTCCNGQCCDGTCCTNTDSTKFCAPSGTVCCPGFPGGFCPPGTFCCVFSGVLVCCPSDGICCPNGCCASGSICGVTC